MTKLFEKIKKGLGYLVDGLYSIGEGMSTISLYPDSTSHEEVYIPGVDKSHRKDYKSLKDDWKIVGKDLENAIKNFEKENIIKK